MSMVTLSAALGAALKNLRKIHVLREHVRLASDADHNRRTILSNEGQTAYNTSDSEDARAYAEDVSHFDDEMRPGLESMYIAYRTALEGPNSLFGVIASELAASDEDVENGAIDYEYLETDGVVTILRRLGILGKLHREMTRDKYVVVGNSITVGTLTADPDNTGTIEITSGGVDKFFPNCPSGTFTFTVTDASIGAPKLSVAFTPTTAGLFADGEGVAEASESLQLERAFTDGKLGLNGFKLSRADLDAPTEAGDTAAIFSAWAVTTPQDGDSNEGTFYFTLYRQDSTTFILHVFNDDARALSNLVGQLSFTYVPAGTTSPTLVLLNGTSITVTISHTAANTELPTSDDGPYDTASISIGQVAEGDTWTLAVTNDYAGKFSTQLMNAWRAHLPFGPLAPTGVATDALAGAGAGNVDNGSYLYYVSFTSLLGESGIGPASGGVTVTDKTVDGKVALSAIPTGPAGTLTREIYRSDDAGATKWFVASVAGNVTTTYEDNIAQATVEANRTPLTEFDEDYATPVTMD